ncbi:hypothetical protein DFH08DRAFT_814593 [Mycena albidolilacea]|uniref:Uncharacterized protein n=1 Tax=Mycena albidolilacea TaxID=1033008 RepID=A0AAD6ZPU7_9AGAR|nr:hypothetical protein DFH08DRAFT_814593 [Mycena albidolilacea]
MYALGSVALSRDASGAPWAAEGTGDVWAVDTLASNGVTGIRGLLRQARKVEPPRLHPLLPAQYWRNVRLDRPHSSPHLPLPLLPPLLDTLCFLDSSKSPRISLQILGTRTHVIVFQHLARSLLPLASTTTMHHDIERK